MAQGTQMQGHGAGRKEGIFPLQVLGMNSQLRAENETKTCCRKNFQSRKQIPGSIFPTIKPKPPLLPSEAVSSCADPLLCCKLRISTLAKSSRLKQLQEGHKSPVHWKCCVCWQPSTGNVVCLQPCPTSVRSTECHGAPSSASSWRVRLAPGWRGRLQD